jgi:hypothetical protein
MKSLLALAAAVMPRLAAACPSCGQETSPRALLLVGAMILVPYGVAAVVYRVVREAIPRDPP